MDKQIGSASEKKLFNYIIDEIKKDTKNHYSDVKAFKQIAPNLDISSSTFYRWRKEKDGRFSSPYKYIKKIITDALGVDESLWEEDSEIQIAWVKEGIDFLKQPKKEEVPDITNISIKNLMPNDPEISDEQKKALEAFKNSSNEVRLIEDFIQNRWLKKESENQNFLLELSFIIYDKGLYGLLLGSILPILMPKYRNSVDIRHIEANARGSLFEPNEAYQIFEQLQSDCPIKNINFKTSAISNIKRIMLLTENREKLREYLTTLIENYQKVHHANDEKSYYTGINLVYMIELGRMIFPKDKSFDINTSDIYHASKNSFETDKTHKEYYVWMSKYEFQILIGYKTDTVIDIKLEEESPAVSDVQRTIRQIDKFFVQVAERFSVRDNIKLDELKKLVELLRDYVKVR